MNLTEEDIKTIKYQHNRGETLVKKGVGIREIALIIIDQKDQNVEMSSRNIPNVKVLRTEGLNVYDILKYQNLVIMESSIKGIEGRLLS